MLLAGSARQMDRIEGGHWTVHADHPDWGNVGRKGVVSFQLSAFSAYITYCHYNYIYNTSRGLNLLLDLKRASPHITAPGSYLILKGQAKRAPLLRLRRIGFRPPWVDCATRGQC